MEIPRLSFLTEMITAEIFGKVKLKEYSFNYSVFFFFLTRKAVAVIPLSPAQHYASNTEYDIEYRLFFLRLHDLKYFFMNHCSSFKHITFVPFRSRRMVV